MEKLVGEIKGWVFEVKGTDGIKQKQFHYFIETEPGKRKEIVIEGEPPHQKSDTFHPLIGKRCQADGTKYQGKFIIQKENIKPLNEALKLVKK